MESNKEIRHCGCGHNNMNMNTNMNCEYTPDGINAAFGYNTVSNLMDDMNCNC